MNKRLVLLSVLAVCGGCASFNNSDGPPASGSVQSLPQTQQTPRAEPRSRYGNPPSYVQFGRTYTILDSADGYRERGIASWYGKKFHGERTSSGETYDMYALSAAHKTLPIPCWVRVTNLENQRSMLIRVNDRGPFVDDRLIDLSYAAANALGVIENGTARVEVQAISFDDSGNEFVAPAPAPVAVAPVSVQTQPSLSAPATATTSVPAMPDSAAAAASLTMQVGAYASFANAERQLDLLVREGITDSYIEHGADGKIYRVRIDNLADQMAFDAMSERLQRLGITKTRLVTP